MHRYCVACGAERTGIAACEEHGEGSMVAKVPLNKHVELDMLARSMGTLTVQRDTFDAGQRVTIKGSIGRLPYLLTISREWGDSPTAEEVALVALRQRLRMEVK